MSNLRQCALYILDTEQCDFNNYVLDGGTAKFHIYAKAYTAIYGPAALKAYIKKLKAEHV